MMHLAGILQVVMFAVLSVPWFHGLRIFHSCYHLLVALPASIQCHWSSTCCHLGIPPGPACIPLLLPFAPCSVPLGCIVLPSLFPPSIGPFVTFPFAEGCLFHGMAYYVQWPVACGSCPRTRFAFAFSTMSNTLPSQSRTLLLSLLIHL